MTRLYIPAQSVALAQAISQAIWSVLCSNPKAGTGYAPWIVHPTTRAVMLMFYQEDTQPIMNPGAASQVAMLLQPFVTAGDITQAQLTEMEASVQASAGKRVQVISLIPAFWLGQQQTQTQLQAEGWFPSLPSKT